MRVSKEQFMALLYFVSQFVGFGDLAIKEVQKELWREYLHEQKNNNLKGGEIKDE